MSAWDAAFVGRETELSGLRQCAAAAHQGQPWVVWLEGEPGVGKTELLRRWLREPVFEGFSVLRACGDTLEADWALGVVGQLLRGVPASMLEDLPLLAGGLSAAAAPFQVAAQMLALVSRLQEVRPVALVIDDVQWADEASLRVLGFVMRRLEADAVLTVLVARRGEQASLAQVRRAATARDWSYQVVLEGLNTAEVAQLAERVVGHAMTAGAAERLRRHTSGNALYVRTLLAELPAESLTGARGSLPVPPSLTAAVVGQLGRLPEPTRRLVEAAAVLDARSPLPLVAQVAEVEDAVEALEPALEAGLLQWWPNAATTPVAMTHALQREVIVAVMSPVRRQAMHAVAVPLVDRAASWSHKVAAAAGKIDAALATELEAEAGRQADDGAVERAATLLLWASDLAATRPERERLLLTAAARLTWIDKFAQVEPLLPAIRACAPSPLRSLALGAYAMSRGTAAAAEAEAELTNALTTAENEPGQAWVAAMAGFWLGWLHLVQARYEESISTLTHVLALDGVDPSLTYRAAGYLCISANCIGGSAAALEHFARTVHAVQAGQETLPGTYMLNIRGQLRGAAGALTGSADDLSTALRRSQATGYPVMEEYAYGHLSCTQYWLGEWDESAINADHAVTVSTTENRPWGLPLAYAAASFVRSGRGQWDRAEQLVQCAIQWAQTIGGHFEPFAATGEAVLAQAKGDYPGVLTALQPVLRTPDEGWSLRFATWWRPLYAEALIESGLLDEAAQAVTTLEQLSEGPHPHLRTAAAWLGGRLAHHSGKLQQAHACYEKGLARTATGDEPPLHRALLELAYARLLTDQHGQHDQALHRLRQAHDRFTQLGAAPFAARCTPGSHTTTAEPRPASPAYQKTLAKLTDRERDIAHLVSHGLTNNEVAGKLFISTKTVEYHLGHVYAKLALANRRQLREHLQHQNTPAQALT